MLVFAELGRVLASVPLLGHLPATLLHADESLADGTRRAAVRRRRPLGLDDATRAKACDAGGLPCSKAGR